mgnify:CR=1 FL=1
MLAHRSVKQSQKVSNKRQKVSNKSKQKVNKKLKKKEKGQRHNNLNLVYHGHHGQSGYDNTFFAPAQPPNA